MMRIILVAVLLTLLAGCGGECGEPQDYCKGQSVYWSACTTFLGDKGFYRLHSADGKDKDFMCGGATVVQMDACSGAVIDAFTAACQ